MPERRGIATAAAWAEILSAAAVVVSLFYVGSEVRRNTAATQAATFQQAVQASDQYLLALATDSSLARIVMQTSAGSGALSDVDGQRYVYITRVFWRNMDNAWVQYHRGVLGESEWDVCHTVACQQKTREPDWSWSLHRPTMSPDFAALMDTCQLDVTAAPVTMGRRLSGTRARNSSSGETSPELQTLAAAPIAV